VKGTPLLHHWGITPKGYSMDCTMEYTFLGGKRTAQLSLGGTKTPQAIFGSMSLSQKGMRYTHVRRIV
jgi:hypothetical protein